MEVSSSRWARKARPLVSNVSRHAGGDFILAVPILFSLPKLSQIISHYKHGKRALGGWKRQIALFEIFLSDY